MAARLGAAHGSNGPFDGRLGPCHACLGLTRMVRGMVRGKKTHEIFGFFSDVLRKSQRIFGRSPGKKCVNMV